MYYAFYSKPIMDGGAIQLQGNRGPGIRFGQVADF